MQLPLRFYALNVTFQAVRLLVQLNFQILSRRQIYPASSMQLTTFILNEISGK